MINIHKFKFKEKNINIYKIMYELNILIINKIIFKYIYIIPYISLYKKWMMNH